MISRLSFLWQMQKDIWADLRHKHFALSQLSRNPTLYIYPRLEGWVLHLWKELFHSISVETLSYYILVDLFLPKYLHFNITISIHISTNYNSYPNTRETSKKIVHTSRVNKFHYCHADPCQLHSPICTLHWHTSSNFLLVQLISFMYHITLLSLTYWVFPLPLCRYTSCPPPQSTTQIILFQL